MRANTPFLVLGLGLLLPGCTGILPATLDSQDYTVQQMAAAPPADNLPVERPKSADRKEKTSVRTNAESYSRSETVGLQTAQSSSSQTKKSAEPDKDAGSSERRRAALRDPDSLSNSIATGQQKWQDWIDRERQRDDALKQKLIICRGC